MTDNDSESTGVLEGGKVSRRQVLQGAGALSASAFLAACGGSRSHTKPQAAGPARRGGNLTIATGDGLGRDLFVGNSFGPQLLAESQFAWPLFRFAPGTFKVIPALATGYTVSGGSRVHTVTLRKGIRFHDGTPIDAKAVVANLKAAFYEHAPLRDNGIYLMIPLFWNGFPGIVEKIRAKDPGTIEFTLNEARANLRGALAFIPICNPRVLKQKDYGTKVSALRDAGSGPFRVSDFSPGEFAEFVKVPGFFEEAYLDRLRLQVTPDASARFLALRSGQAQAAIGLSKADWDANAGSPDYRRHVGLRSTSVFIGYNVVAGKEFNDPRVREALIRGTNRAKYVDAFWGKGLASQASMVALVPESLSPAPDVPQIPYDPQGAKRLIQAAGMTGKTIAVISPANFAAAPEMSALLSAAAQDLSQIGIKLKIHITDIAGWLAGTRGTDMFATAFGNAGEVAAPTAALYFAPAPSDAVPPDDKRWLNETEAAQAAPDPDTLNKRLTTLMTDSSAAFSGLPLAYAAPAALSNQDVHDLSVSSAPIDPQHRAWIG